MNVHALRSAASAAQAARIAAPARTELEPGSDARPTVHERLDRVELIARAGLLTVDRARELLAEQHGPLDLALQAVAPARLASRAAELRLL